MSAKFAVLTATEQAGASDDAPCGGVLEVIYDGNNTFYRGRTLQFGDGLWYDPITGLAVPQSVNHELKMGYRTDIIATSPLAPVRCGSKEYVLIGTKWVDTENLQPPNRTAAQALRKYDKEMGEMREADLIPLVNETQAKDPVLAFLFSEE